MSLNRGICNLAKKSLKKTKIYRIYHEMCLEIIGGAGVKSQWDLLRNPARIKFWLNLRRVRRIDRKYGTDFSGAKYGRIKQDALGTSVERANDYSASPRDVIYALRRYKISQSDSIIDIGCGKGLAMYYMAQFPFGHIAGLELSEALIGDVYTNLTKIIKPKCSQEVLRERFSLIVADAGLYQKYDDFNFFYIYNSLPKGVMREFVERVKESNRRNPRKIVLLYLMPEYPDEVLDAGGFRLIKKGRKTEIRYGMWIFESI